MADEMEFDFTDAELFDAFRLLASDAEARQQTATVRSALDSSVDWAASREFLLLLSVASATGREKVERIRKVEEEARLTTFVRSEMSASGADCSDSEVQLRVQAVAEVEDRRWQAERAELREKLLNQGKRLPNEP